MNTSKLAALLFFLTGGWLRGAAPARAATSEAVPEIAVAFQVVDPVTMQPVPGKITLTDPRDSSHRSVLIAGLPGGAPTPPFNLTRWAVTGASSADVKVIRIAAGRSATISGEGPLPVRDIYIKITATRLQIRAATDTTSGAIRGKTELNTFTNKTSTDTRSLTQGQAGVASDSSGQQHIRGEHADITFVVDGVPLPDTLSGRQGAIVVPSTIQSLDLLTGGYAPEFGGQTAAVLNIRTLPGARQPHEDITLQGGEFSTRNGTFTAVGPAGKNASYVVNVDSNASRNASEPPQPDNQAAHNAGASQDYFVSLRDNPSRRDRVTVTLSHAPGSLQVANRTGLPPSFASVGQGFGFLGLRNPNGARPDVTPDNANALGAQNIPLPTQQTAGMDINDYEVNEFGIVSWERNIAARDTGLLSLTFLHSGQQISNRNPAVDGLSLPIDNSIEYNPTAIRNAHHVQLIGSYAAPRGHHAMKVGFLLDSQAGDESYHIIPASQLALDAIAAVAPLLAPRGTTAMGLDGAPVADVNGNPVYTPTSAAVPTVSVHRTGWYRAAYLQDTWSLSRRLTANYGLRGDWYRQVMNLGQAPVDTIHVSPRLNFSYSPERQTVFRFSYDRLLNTPPLAQGAILGQAIQPELINQYEADLDRQLTRTQSLKLAYYYKQIHNQVDTGLLIPGSQIGLYSAVNFQYGAVHGLEFSYDISPPHGVGLDAYLNYTYSLAQPNGLDNTGAPAPQYNDHDQRHTVGAGLAYLFKGGASAAMTFTYESGLASSVIFPGSGRVPRTDLDLHLTTGPHLFSGRGGLGLDVTNLFDERRVINFESGFSGTRFSQGRRILLSVFGSF